MFPSLTVYWFLSFCVLGLGNKIAIKYEDHVNMDSLSLVPALDAESVIRFRCECDKCKIATLIRPNGESISKEGNSSVFEFSFITNKSFSLGDYSCQFEDGTSVNATINYAQCVSSDVERCDKAICITAITSSGTQKHCQDLTTDTCDLSHEKVWNSSSKSKVCSKNTSDYTTLCHALVEYVFKGNPEAIPLVEITDTTVPCPTAPHASAATSIERKYPDYTMLIASVPFDCEHHVRAVALGSVYHVTSGFTYICYLCPADSSVDVSYDLQYESSEKCEKGRIFLPVKHGPDRPFSKLIFSVQNKSRSYFYILDIQESIISQPKITVHGDCRRGSPATALNCSVDLSKALKYMDVHFQWINNDHPRNAMETNHGHGGMYSILHVPTVGNYTCFVTILRNGHNLYKEQDHATHQLEATFSVDKDCSPDVPISPQKNVPDFEDYDLSTDTSVIEKYQTIIIILVILLVLALIAIFGALMYRRRYKRRRRELKKQKELQEQKETVSMSNKSVASPSVSKKSVVKKYGVGVSLKSGTSKRK